MNINPIVNVVYANLNNSVSVLRHRNQKSLFDYLLVANNKDIEYFYTDDIVQNYYYDLFITDDILLQDPIHTNINDSQIKTIIAVHHEPPGFFKKEDVLIHHKTTKNIPKIFFDPNLIDKWKCENDNNAHYIEYGTPLFYNSEFITEDRKYSVVIMNLENNPYIDNLYNSIQSQIPDCLMIKNLKPQTQIQEITTLLHKAKITININSKINTLVALSCGCQTITSINNLSNPLLTHINNYANIVDVIKNLLAVNLEEKYRQIAAEQVSTKYSYIAFVQNMNSIFQTYKKQPYIL